MKILSSLIKVIENPLKIYKYDKVILNNSFQSHDSLWSYLKKIFVNYDKQYLKSFKYFIKICENNDFLFINGYNNTIIVFINYIIQQNNKNYIKYYKNYKKILIYLINKYKNLEIYSLLHTNILFYLNPAINHYSKLNFKLYKYYKLYH
jgi:hypothetical protein